MEVKSSFVFKYKENGRETDGSGLTDYTYFPLFGIVWLELNSLIIVIKPALPTYFSVHT